MNWKIFCITAATLVAPQAVEAQKLLPKKVQAYNHNTLPAPPGMVYVPGGSIVINFGADDDSSNLKRFSLSPFFIDKTEVTNRQYREFVNWVIDSVAITEFIKNDAYFTKEHRDSSHRYINWKKVNHNKILRKHRDALAAVMDNGQIRTSLYNYTLTYQRADRSGTREEVAETVNVYPDTEVWAKDFPNSQTYLIMKDYFTNPAFDDYPVVGVNWKQARAYAHWKTLTAGNAGHRLISGFNLPYTLPSEAQWAYAAQGLAGGADTLIRLTDNKDRLLVNFKQAEGEYNKDGSSYTVPVMSYAPNEFGVYNLLGNVAEWVLDAYNASAWAFVHDQNPVLLYDADSADSDLMKSKVIRGGSWKDNAGSLDPHVRDYEVQDRPHSYIGFRLVMPAPEILTNQVQTRRRSSK